MSAKKGLGRGFSSLIPTELLDESFDPTAEQDERISELRHIKLEEVMPDPDQPRRTFDETALGEMTASVREHGVLQPIVVTPKGGKYLIVAGERRYRASRAAGLDKIPAIVRTLNDQHKLELSLIENLQRRDLNVLETATAYLKLRDQFNLSLEDIGMRVGGKSVSAVSNTLRLLRLPASVHQAMIDEVLREGQVRPLIGLDEAVIDELLPRMIKEEWSSRRTEQVVADIKKGVSASPQKVVRQVPNYDSHRDTIAERLHLPIAIRANTKGGGTVVISFKDDAELAQFEASLKK